MINKHKLHTEIDGGCPMFLMLSFSENRARMRLTYRNTALVLM